MPLKNMIALSLSGLAMWGCATMPSTTSSGSITPDDRAIPTGFLNKAITLEDGERRYVVYVPADYDPSRAWPLILFLHGMGERGDDGLIQSEVGIGRAIRRHAKRFPCLVVMPQCPGTGNWDDVGHDDIQAALDLTLAQYKIDPARIYLTGLSMGGYGTWMIGAAQSDVFAALMPVCGGGNVEDGPKLAGIPIWAFHGLDDKVVEIDKSREMVKAVRQAGGKVKFSEFPDTGHNSWDKAYGDPKAIKWLLKQRKGG